jgi:hypothetical protein
MPQNIVNVRLVQDGAAIGLMSLDLRTPPVSGLYFGGASGYNINIAAGISQSGVQVVGPVNTEIPAAQHPGAAPSILRASVSGIPLNWPTAASGDVLFGRSTTWPNGVPAPTLANSKKLVYSGPGGPTTTSYN